METYMYEKGVCYMADLPSVVSVYSLLLIKKIILFCFSDQVLLFLYFDFCFQCLQVHFCDATKPL